MGEISDIKSAINRYPVIVYNSKELQMSTAFYKSYMLESGGYRVDRKQSL